MYFELYIGDGFRWRLRAGNHEIIAQGEKYENYEDCNHAIKLLQQTTEETPVEIITQWGDR